jgi:hypothetical protein
MSLDQVEPKTPRFNMPFELGLAVALAGVVKNEYVLLDTIQDRLGKALSDARGLDAQLFDGTAMGIFRALSNIFYRSDFEPSPRHFNRVLVRLKATAARIRKEYGYESLFEARPFADLRRDAARLSNHIRHMYIPISRKRQIGAVR